MSIICALNLFHFVGILMACLTKIMWLPQSYSLKVGWGKPTKSCFIDKNVCVMENEKLHNSQKTIDYCTIIIFPWDYWIMNEKRGQTSIDLLFSDNLRQNIWKTMNDLWTIQMRNASLSSNQYLLEAFVYANGFQTSINSFLFFKIW